VLGQAGFVEAARLGGNSELRILLAQVLPNTMPLLAVQMSLTMGYAILNALASPLSASASARRPRNGALWSPRAPVTSSLANGGWHCAT
jgi:peptide/nickel transport system permease protein